MEIKTNEQLYKNMTKEQKRDAIREYEKSKLSYYRKLLIWIVAISAMSEVSYFVSDCMLFGEFAWATLIPRFSIIIPLAIFLLIFTNTTKCDRYLSLATYIMAHLAMWCTIWAVYICQPRILPEKVLSSCTLCFWQLVFVLREKVNL